MLTAFEQLAAATKPSPQRKRTNTRVSGWIHSRSLSARILRILEDGKERSVGELAQALGARHDSTGAALYRLEAKNLVVKAGVEAGNYTGPDRPLYRRGRG